MSDSNLTQQERYASERRSDLADFDAASALKRLSQGQQAKREAQREVSVRLAKDEVVRAAREWHRQLGAAWPCDHPKCLVNKALREAVERLEAELGEGE